MPSHKTLYALAARLAFLCAAALLTACGGGASTAEDEAALRAAQPGELAAYFRARLVQRNTRAGDVLLGGGAAPPDVPFGDSAVAGTTLQEAGVDEDDLLKSDGHFVYALSPGYWMAHDRQMPARLDVSRIQPNGSLAPAGTVALDPETAVTGMYLAQAEQRIAIVGTRQGRLSLDLYDMPGGAPPVRAAQFELDGELIGTRRIGAVLYVASRWSPDLSRYSLQYGVPAAQASAALAKLDASALLPMIRTNRGPATALVAEQDCHLQPANASIDLQLTTITAIDLSTPALERRSRCLVGNGDSLYMSESAAYVATSRNYWMSWDFGLASFTAELTTDIHKFALEGLRIGYRGSAEVKGHLGHDREKAPYRMSEHEGDLRVVTFTDTSGWGGVGEPIPMLAAEASSAASPLRATTPAPVSPATLTVLRESAPAGRLIQVATLPNARRPAPLGNPGEQIYAVRFAGPMAYLVTFRRTDPLYVLNLSDPADPKAAGELTMPGFSDYLYPLANGKLLGIGKDATATGVMQGLKVALFDVSDPAHPRELSSLSLGERGTMSALDFTRHGISILQGESLARIALPVRLTATTPAGYPQPVRQGLARFVVDAAAGTLVQRPMAVTLDFDSNTSYDTYYRFNLANERSIQTTGATYYLSGGAVSYIAEP